LTIRRKTRRLAARRDQSRDSLIAAGFTALRMDYAVALSGGVVYARRQARKRRRQEALIEPFA